MINADRDWVLIIDSGAGAAGVYEWMRSEERLRGVNLIVFADRMNFPFGAQEQDNLRRIVNYNVNLVDEHVDRFNCGTMRALVIASCTASMATASHLREILDIPVFDVITASALSAIRIAHEIKTLSSPVLSTGKPPGEAIGILATVLTVQSRAYRRAIHAMDPKVKVVSEPGYDLIRNIQNHDYSQRSIGMIKSGIREKIAFFESQGVGVIVLGCTHFSLFRDLFVKEASGRMIIVDPTECIITDLTTFMRGSGHAREGAACGDTILFKTTRSPGGGKELSVVSLPGSLNTNIHRLHKQVERFILSDDPRPDGALSRAEGSTRALLY